jgi:hypothetical protein
MCIGATSAPRHFTNAKIGRPLRQVGARMMSQAKALAPFEWIAAQALHEYRRAGVTALRHEGARPFEMEWSRSGAGLTTVDDPL